MGSIPSLRTKRKLFMPKGFISPTAGLHYQGLVAYNKQRMKPLEDLLVENSVVNKPHFKKRLIAANIIPFVCAECNQEPFWNGKPLVLQLDRKNGDNFDNRIENLRFLCPNCHTQTPTFSRGQKKKNNQARKQKLLSL